MQVQLLGPNGKPLVQRMPVNPIQHGRNAVRARYDAAQTTDHNRRHWAESDGLSARAANSLSVRTKLRNRARYEIANNSYAKGIIETLANDMVGTGPRLQLLTKDAELNRVIEAAFGEWCEESCLAEKLRTMRKARAGDGEAFGLLITNPKMRCDVQLDLRLVECDQVTTPTMRVADPLQVDGIDYDGYGNPIVYTLLKEHPGDYYAWAWEYDEIPASLVIHWFRKDRPGQCRGVPEITPAIELFGQLRRYTLATLTAAETAANFAAMLESAMPPDDDTLDGDPFETLEIVRGMMTTLPAGWKMSQLRAEHPTTTYKEFKGEILNEIARCLNIPFNVAAGNSSGYNYASGRLDHQVYFKSQRIDQSHAERVILDRLLYEWLAEASMVTDLVPQGVNEWPHQWFWDGVEHVDPQKEANAQTIRLTNRTTSYAREFARMGLDWEDQFQQIAAEQKRAAELGIVLPGTTPPVSPAPVTQEDPEQDGGGGNSDPEDG
jgi:lambda family phage portal protein